MKSKYDYEIIRDYLHGLLDKDTAQKIRDLIRNDEVARSIAAGILQLEHEFNGNENEIEAYIESLRQKQLKLIDGQPEAVETKKEKVVSFGWAKLAAAILIIALAAAVVWLTMFDGEKKDLLAQELSEPYPLTTIDRGSDADVGFEFYLRGEYEKAAGAFGDKTDDVNVVFYNGLSQLYSANYEKAVKLLSSSFLETSRYREQALWFYSLALVKSGRNEEAKLNLGKIGNEPTHYKSAEARELLSTLED